MRDNPTIRDLIMEYFIKHPYQDIPHGPVVDYVEAIYFNLYRKKPRDSWREIRRLHQEGMLIKVKKGIYRYDPDAVIKRELFVFSEEIKREIFKRDNYKCVVCGRGPENGVEIHADHKIPFDKGGDNSIENGQTLCSEHNFLKKNYGQTEFGKRLIKRLYEDAIKNNDEKMIEFCEAILNVYDKFGINGHIKVSRNIKKKKK